MIKYFKNIKELYVNTISNGTLLPHTLEPFDVLKECEKNKCIIESEKCFCGYCKTFVGSNECVRLIFAVREGTKKVHNIEKTVAIIKDVEKDLIYLDSCNITKSADGFVYIDVIKEIKK